MNHELVSVATVSGMIEAEILRGLLESYGISSALRREAAASALAVGVGRLGEVHIMVRSESASEAREVIERYRSGQLGSG